MSSRFLAHYETATVQGNDRAPPSNYVVEARVAPAAAVLAWVNARIGETAQAPADRLSPLLVIVPSSFAHLEV